jgi:DNA-binding response OmpR family regulator
MIVPKKRVLVIDDNLDTLKLLKETLEENDFECITASSAIEGLERAIAVRPHLVLLDLMLPRMSGFGFLREFRGHPELNGIPIVVITALGDEEIATEVMDLGAVGYLRKACGTQELLSMVEEYSL